jgi:hypothetical protein
MMAFVEMRRYQPEGETHFLKHLMHCVASSRGAIAADPAESGDAPRVEETGVGHGPG